MPPAEGAPPASGPPAFDAGYQSPDARVNRVLDRYRGQMRSERDIALIEIFVHYDSVTRPLLVPNPRVHRKNVAVVWQHDVKTALGIQGSLMDMWLRPISLRMIQSPSMRLHQGRGRQQQQPTNLHFEPSSAHGGHSVVWAAYLETGAVYEVEMEDRREDALRKLTEEQTRQMADTFRSLDADGSNTISRVELEAHMRDRNEARRAKISEQCERFKAQNPGRSDEAEANKAEHLQKMQEGEEKMMQMFAAADIDGNGVLSWTEFSMAEAWWLSSSINPDKVNLFD